MWVLIPAYEPGDRLIPLIQALRPHAPVLVVDDGSGPGYRDVFDGARAAGAVVLHHPVNLGKAAALRTGFAWVERHAPAHLVVCADSDGQHTPADVLRVAAAQRGRMDAGEPDGIVLGSRAFAGDVPARSRFGNRVATALVASIAGRTIHDTQTGLRALPPGLLRWARAVPGERFAYELRMLLEATRGGIPVLETPIATVYLDQNTGSHFRPVIDSLRVLTPLAVFGLSSLAAFGIDTVALLALHAVTGSLAVALVGARTLSAAVNFTLNRRAVFHARGPVLPQLVRYGALAGVLLGAGYGGLHLLTALGAPLVVAKVITDLVLFVASFLVQRALVFAPRLRRRSHAPAFINTQETAPRPAVSRAVRA